MVTVLFVVMCEEFTKNSWTVWLIPWTNVGFFGAVPFFSLTNLYVKSYWQIWWRRRYFFRILPDNVSGQPVDLSVARLHDTVLSIFISRQRIWWKIRVFLILGFLSWLPDIILSFSVFEECFISAFLCAIWFVNYLSLLSSPCLFFQFCSFIISLIFFFKALIFPWMPFPSFSPLFLTWKIPPAHCWLSTLWSGRLACPHPRRRRPIILSIAQNADILRNGVFSPYIDALFDSVFLLAFYACLRCGEFTTSSKSFNRDISFSDLAFHPSHYSPRRQHSKCGSAL